MPDAGIRGLSRFHFRVPDPGYWKEQIKCQAACPVHTDARGYVRAIANGDYELAYLIARSPNPLASICGRVCGAPYDSGPETIRLRKAWSRVACDRGYGAYRLSQEGSPKTCRPSLP